MKGLEAAIRNALAKAGHTDAQMRARIYQSARSALESGLRKQGISDPEIVSQQRHKLEALIESIEREERLLQTERQIVAEKAAAAAAVSAPEAPRHDPDIQGETEPDAQANDAPHADTREEEVQPAPIAPSIDMQGESRAPATPVYEDYDLGGVDDEARLGASVQSQQQSETSDDELAANTADDRIAARKQKKKPRRRWRARAFSVVILIAFGAAAYWWADSSGILLSPQEKDTSVPNPPPTASEEDFEGPGLQSFRPERGFGEGWETAYDPNEGGTVDRGSDVSVEVKREGDSRFLLVSAPAGGADSSVSLAIPQSVLAEMAGNKSVIAVSARGVSENAQLSVACDFAGSEGCGRHRFTLSDDKSDLIFEVDTPSNAGSAGDGKLRLNVAAGGSDGEMELYGVHIAPKGEVQPR